MALFPSNSSVELCNLAALLSPFIPQRTSGVTYLVRTTKTTTPRSFPPDRTRGGDNVSPPYHYLCVRGSPSPIPAHTKMHVFTDTKRTSPKEASSGHQHAVPVKSNTVYAFARPLSTASLSFTDSLSYIDKRMSYPAFPPFLTCITHT